MVADSVCRNPDPDPSPNPDSTPNLSPSPSPNPSPNPSPSRSPKPNPKQACRAGHEGVLCAGCMAGFTRSAARLCEPFDADEGLVALGAALLSIGTLLVSAMLGVAIALLCCRLARLGLGLGFGLGLGLGSGLGLG